MTAQARHREGELVRARGYAAGDGWADATVRHVVRTAVGVEYMVVFRRPGGGWARKARWAEVQPGGGG